MGCNNLFIVVQYYSQKSTSDLKPELKVIQTHSKTNQFKIWKRVTITQEKVRFIIAYFVVFQGWFIIDLLPILNPPISQVDD